MTLILVCFDVHIQLTVVMAVRKAVSAATITFAATSIILFFITFHSSLFTFHYSLAKRLALIKVITAVTTCTTRVDHEA